MIDKYTTLCDAIAENPIAANILMSYGIPTYYRESIFVFE